MKDVIDKTAHVPMARMSLISSVDLVTYTMEIDGDDNDDSYMDYLDNEEFENEIDPREYRW